MQLVSLGLGERGDGRFFVGGGGEGGYIIFFEIRRLGDLRGGRGGRVLRVLGFRGEEGEKRGEETYTAIFRPSTTVAVAVEARHGRLGEEGQGFAEDFYVTSRN